MRALERLTGPFWKVIDRHHNNSSSIPTAGDSDAHLAPESFTEANAHLDPAALLGLVSFQVLSAGLDGPPVKGLYVRASIGNQTWMSRTEHGLKQRIDFGGHEGHSMILQRGSATAARIELLAHGQGLRGQGRSTLLGWCEVELVKFLQPEAAGLHSEQLHLLDPQDSTHKVGTLCVYAKAADPAHLEQQLWTRLLAMADFNHDERLSLAEFHSLMQSLGNALDGEQLAHLFQQADPDGSGLASSQELAALLHGQQAERGLQALIRRSPVSGAQLRPGREHDLENLLYMTLQMDDSVAGAVQGGFTTSEQASRRWMLKLTEWGPQPFHGSGPRRSIIEQPGRLHVGRNASQILIFDRARKRVVPETISPSLVLAMRQMYQTPLGRVMLGHGGVRVLQDMTTRDGRRMDTPESAEAIPKFLAGFAGEIDTSTFLEPVSSYKTFNEFFYRQLKPGARPIAEPDQPSVMVSAADCRLTAFYGVDEAMRCWVKGKCFSIAGLLDDRDAGQPLASQFEGGSLLIMRLAPQDYHRFHFCCNCTLTSRRAVPGPLYTVNPIAVNSTFNVLGDNKREVCLLDSPDFGLCAFVAVGATMVGSICCTAEAGQAAAKGDSLGYFAFGGSTCILLVQKGRLVIDPDLEANSLKSLETLVRMGERIGVAPGSRMEHSDSQKELIRSQTQECSAHLANEGQVALLPDLLEDSEHSVQQVLQSKQPTADFAPVQNMPAN